MCGVRSGAQTLMTKEESWALCVHCLAHNLNLTLKHVTRKCQLVRNDEFHLRLSPADKILSKGYLSLIH